MRRRLFFALWPDPGLAQRLLEAARPLSASGARLMAPEDLHVTLCFLGAVDESVIPALCERAAALRAHAFELEFEALEYWPRSGIIAATGTRTPSAASELVDALRSLARALDLAPDDQPFTPHMTLMRRLAAGRRPVAYPLASAASLRLAAHCFHLARSQQLEAANEGAAPTPRYLKLASWPLAADGS